ncbi:MAG: endonuclease III, partial [Rickettsiaceae bacterium]|nr:endonuclease III [Rickettsiaceae bacterium]
AEHNPNPKTELIFNNNFTLLIAIILSAQATDKSVNKATEILFKEYNNPKDILKLGLDGLKEHIKIIGLYNSKATNIIELCKLLLLQNEKIPDNFTDLIKLPGVGRKTANVYLNIVHKMHNVAVDTHVARVSKRLGLTSFDNPQKIEQDLLNSIPSKFLSNAHNWLVLHGRYICKARKPLCKECFLAENCKYNLSLVTKS